MTEATPAQQGIWFTEQAGIAGTAYHLAVGLRFDEGVDEAALLAACADVASRHPALGSVVTVADGVPHLRPGPVPPVLRAALPGELVEEVRRPIDLVRGPLARFVVDTGGPGAAVLFVAHHLVFDGTSKDVLVADLAAAYAARRGTPARNAGTGEDGAVPDGAVPVAAAPDGDAPVAAESDGDAPDDDAVVLAAAREYWATNPLPDDGVVLPGLDRVPDSAEPGVAVPDILGPAVSSALDAAAARLGASRFEVLLAALNALLFRYGNPAPVVATDLSTRGPADAGRIGSFVNELPVGPAAPEAFEGSFAGLVTALRARLREVYRVRTVPLGRAVLGLRARTAMAPVSLSYRRRAADPGFDGTGTTVDWSIFPGSVGNALHLQVVDDGSSLELSLRHSPAALPPDAARRILAHLRTLLGAALAAPDTAVTALPLLPPDERDLVVTHWNATDRDWPAGVTLPGLFAEQARRTPHAVAVTGPTLPSGSAGTDVAGSGSAGSGASERSLGYGELSAAVDALAGELRAQGVGRGDLVAVCLPRSVDLVVALLAVAATSAAYVPVDPAHPERRQAQILAEAAPRLVVTTADRAARLGDAVPVLVPPAVRAAGDPVPAGDVAGASGPGPDDLAYVMFTSGSTGRPKGVRVPHRALANLLLGMREVLADPTPGAGQAAGGEVWLALTSIGFDISALELFVPLTTGGRVVVVPDGLAADGTAVTAMIHRHGVTHVQATPSGWRVLLAGGLGSAPGPRVLALAGGEALSLPLARELRARVRRLVNVYGPTETTIWSTSEELPEDVDRVTIGRPIANTRAYLLDASGSPVPVGVPGDLYLGGAGVADGYLDRPDLTAAAFGPDPHHPGGTVYRTGDRARHLPDGRLEFLGRADTQVKIRGHRVELGEIEARLLEHPGIAGAAVVLHRDDAEGTDGTDPFLAGYLVPRVPGGEPQPEELRDLLSGWLPAAALPRAWTVLDALPLTPHGKLDRAALPVPARRPVEAPVTRDVPPDKIAEQLRDIWCEVLRIEDIALDEDLFDLGGHSLTITRIIGRIEQHWGVTVPFDDFFDEPTCLGVATSVRRELRAHTGEEGDA